VGLTLDSEAAIMALATFKIFGQHGGTSASCWLEHQETDGEMSQVQKFTFTTNSLEMSVAITGRVPHISQEGFSPTGAPAYSPEVGLVCTSSTGDVQAEAVDLVIWATSE
jgi:hypothetical protein